MENAQENLTIGAFAKAARVNVETIRFYQLRACYPSRSGLRSHPPLRAGGRGAGEVREVSPAPGIQPG